MPPGINKKGRLTTEVTRVRRPCFKTYTVFLPVYLVFVFVPIKYEHYTIPLAEYLQNNYTIFIVVCL